MNTDEFIHHKLCIMWCFGCFRKFCGIQFREGAKVIIDDQVIEIDQKSEHRHMRTYMDPVPYKI